MMNRRTFLAIFLLPLVLVLSSAWAQGAVVDSVDEDIVEEEAPAAAKEPAVVDSASAGKSPAAAKKKKKDLDLDALLAGDDEDDFFGEEKSLVKPSVSDSASSSDSSAAVKAKAGESAADSAAQADGLKAGQASGSKTPAAKVDSADIGPVKIEDGRTINFAHNLKEYRSPRIAMLLSLLVPGLGQAYARSYIKAGAFGAAELTAIGVAVYFNSVGNKKKKEAYDFADEHFSIDSLKKYHAGLEKKFVDFNDGELTEITPPYEFYDTAFYNAAAGKQPYYYESIRDWHFTPGWKDNEPGLDDVLSAGSGEIIYGKKSKSRFVQSSDNPAVFYLLTRVMDNAGNIVNEGPMLGYSSNQAEYNTMMNKSKSYYDAVNYTLYVLLLNHIASAIDAGFTARAYNARLLGQESAWNRFSVEQQYVFTGSDVSPGLALRVRF